MFIYELSKVEYYLVVLIDLCKVRGGSSYLVASHHLAVEVDELWEIDHRITISVETS